MDLGNRSRASYRALVTAILVAALLACASGPTLSKSYSDGKLTITGSSFKPDEQVSILITEPGGTNTSLVLKADQNGTFQIQTEVKESPSVAVRVSARGNQGSQADSG